MRPWPIENPALIQAIERMQAILNAIKNGFYLVDGPVYIADDGANAIFVVPNNPINAAGSAEYPPATAAADIFQAAWTFFLTPRIAASMHSTLNSAPCSSSVHYQPSTLVTRLPCWEALALAPDPTSLAIH